ncbi:6510_t:CDS:2, partial [Cetraspora pellucida]
MSPEPRDLPFPPNQLVCFYYLEFPYSLWSSQLTNLINESASQEDSSIKSELKINEDASQDTITLEDSFSTNELKINEDKINAFDIDVSNVPLNAHYQKNVIDEFSL